VLFNTKGNEAVQSSLAVWLGNGC